MPTPAIAAYVQELRKGRGFTQESLAEAVGVRKRTIERLERHEGNISVEPFERIIAVLRASPDDVNYLATNLSATVDEGKEMARLQFQRDPTTQRATARPAPQQPDPITLGVQTYVRSLREQQSISRKALADAIDLPIGLVADWESGRTGMIPVQALVKAIVHLGATLDDLEQITTATDKHTLLGQRLAEERSAFTPSGGQPSQNARQALHPAPSLQRAVVRRVVAIEGLLHDVVGVLKRAVPTEAAEIERSATLWFQTITSDEA